MALNRRTRFFRNTTAAVDEHLFSQCFDALAEDQSPLKKWLLGLRIRRCLRGCARHTCCGRLLAYAGLVFTKLRRIRHGKIKNKALTSGGAIVAFTGGDATGKSTLVAETAQWLGGTFAVRVAHIGKPTSTWLTAPLHVLLPLARRLFPNQRNQARQAATTSERTSSHGDEPKRSTSLCFALRAVSLAWDRSRLLRKVHRHAAAV